MLRLLKRWLGWEDDDYSVAAELKARVRPRSATAQVLAKGPRKDLGKRARPAPKRTGPEVVDFVEGAPDPAFDPYNTGKFDRGASWDRISKNQR